MIGDTVFHKPVLVGEEIKVREIPLAARMTCYGVCVWCVWGVVFGVWCLVCLVPGKL